MAIVTTTPVKTWTTYNTSLNQNGAVTFTQTKSRYNLDGKVCTYSYYLNITGTGTANNNITIGLPFAAPDNSVFSGFGGWYNGAGFKTYAGGHTFASTTTASLIAHNSTPGSYFGKEPNAALGSGDVIAGTIVYEIA